MISIAFVTELFFPNIGGQEFRFLKLAHGILKKGFDVTVYTTDHTGGTLPKEDKISGVHVVRYVTLKNYVKPGSRSITQLSKFIVATRNLLRRIIKEYDFILINQMPILHLLFLPTEPKICIDWCEVYRKGSLRYLVKLASKRFDKGIAVSEIVAEEIRRANPHASLEIVRTPVEIDKYATSIEQKDLDTILYVGRLVTHKNIDSLINAIIYLNEELHQRKKLIVVGDGPLKHLLTEKYKDHRYIEILGRVDEERKIELFKRSGILAIPSYREGFPNVVAEAIASLTPVLTVKAPLNNVYPFVERHRIGFVASSPSAKHIAETIARISEEEWKYAVINEMRLREEFREEVNINKLISYISRCS